MFIIEADRRNYLQVVILHRKIVFTSQLTNEENFVPATKKRDSFQLNFYQQFIYCINYTLLNNNYKLPNEF